MPKINWPKLLEIAINREIEAASTYQHLAETVKDLAVKELLIDLTQEEKKHQRKLERLDWTEEKEGNLSEPLDLGLTDKLIADSLFPEMTIQDLLVKAFQKEKQAATFYASLAKVAKSSRLKKFFRFLEKQEKSHYLRLKLEYERLFLPED